MKYILLTLLLSLFLGCSEMENEESRKKKDYIEELGYSEEVSNASKIAAYLNDKDPEVVMSACFYIGFLKARDYINDLVLLLDHENPNIVNMAGSGLSEMVDERDSHILPNLYKVLDHDFLLARISSIEAIGSIKSPGSLPVLIGFFKRAGSGEKARIISGLGNIGDKKSLPLLEQYLDEVKEMNHSVPNKGGTRGSDLHPDALQVITEEAIHVIKNGSA